VRKLYKIISVPHQKMTGGAHTPTSKDGERSMGPRHHSKFTRLKQISPFLLPRTAS